MPITEIIAGAVLGTALQGLCEAIKRAKGRSVTTRFILDRLDATIIRITPLVAQIDKISEEVDHSPRKVIEDFKLLLENAASLVEANAELRRRNLRKKFRYTRRIIELEATLRWMVHVDVQVNQWADIKELKTKISEMNAKLERQPTNCICCKSNRSTSQSTNQDIVEEADRSSEKSDESKPMIDIHIGWRSRNKDHAIRVFWK